MAREKKQNLLQLVEGLSQNLALLESSHGSLKPTIKTQIDHIQSLYFTSLKKTDEDKFVNKLLELMGFELDVSGDWKRNQKTNAYSQQLLELFWSYEYFRTFLLKGLLTQSKENTPQKAAQMTAVFQSFEDYTEMMEKRADPQPRWILEDVLSKIPAGSNWFAYYYSWSEKIDPKKKNEEVVHNNLCNFETYYPEKTATDKLKIVAERNPTIVQSMKTEAGTRSRTGLAGVLWIIAYYLFGAREAVPKAFAEKLKALNPAPVQVPPAAGEGEPLNSAADAAAAAPPALQPGVSSSAAASASEGEAQVEANSAGSSGSPQMQAPASAVLPRAETPTNPKQAPLSPNGASGPRSPAAKVLDVTDTLRGMTNPLMESSAKQATPPAIDFSTPLESPPAVQAARINGTRASQEPSQATEALEQGAAVDPQLSQSRNHQPVQDLLADAPPEAEAQDEAAVTVPLQLATEYFIRQSSRVRQFVQLELPPEPVQAKAPTAKDASSTLNCSGIDNTGEMHLNGGAEPSSLHLTGIDLTARNINRVDPTPPSLAQEDSPLAAQSSLDISGIDVTAGNIHGVATTSSSSNEAAPSGNDSAIMPPDILRPRASAAPVAVVKQGQDSFVGNTSGINVSVDHSSAQPEATSPTKVLNPYNVFGSLSRRAAQRSADTSFNYGDDGFELTDDGSEEALEAPGSAIKISGNGRKTPEAEAERFVENVEVVVVSRARRSPKVAQEDCETSRSLGFGSSGGEGQ